MIINEITEITDKIEEIDGEKVYILEKHMKTGVERLKEWTETDNDDGVLTMLNKHLEFICEKQNFAMAFRHINLRLTRWLPCMIYQYEGQWRRVQLEYANCLKCDWKGRIANPTNPGLYCALKNEFELMRKANKLPSCKCPKCGGELSRKAIWVEDEVQD